MKRTRRAPRRPEPRTAVQYFTWGPWEFNVTRALASAEILPVLPGQLPGAAG